MLDLYAIDRLEPWPDDLPADRLPVGSIDIHDFHKCVSIVAPCFEAAGVEISYFTDWIVSADQLKLVLRCLDSSFEAPSSTALTGFVEAIRRAAGHTLLAVCD